jgi:hypothetical protein
MANALSTKRPVSLTVICFLSLAAIVLTVVLYVRIYNRNPYAGILEKKWHLIMIALQLPIIVGVVLMYFLKRMGLWLFLLGKILFFVLPGIAGVDVMGLATPIFFIESATFFILFGKRIHYMN